MRPTRLFILVLPLLAACATTPRAQCEMTYRNQLANLRLDIRETELVLRRGFRLVPATSDIGLHYCVTGAGMVMPCFEETDEPMFDKVPINRKAEAAKLAILQAEQGRLRSGLESCAAQYPEG